MTDPRDRLFKAYGEALSRTTPKLDPRVRQQVLAAQAGPQRSAFPAPYRWALGGLAAVTVVVALLVLSQKPAAPSFEVAGHKAAVGSWLTAEPARPLPLRFSDGTSVTLGRGSQGRVSEVTRGGARIELQRGSFDAEVAHLPGARWSFGAGPFEVAVTGTHLGVIWAPETGQFELAVTSGSVLVKGPFIEGLQAVQAGQVCRVDLSRRVMELAQIAPAPEPDAASAPSASPVTQSSSPAAEPLTRDALPSSAAPLGTARATSAEALLEAARAARLAGRPDEERAALLACRKRAPGQPVAAQAAYLLGRASAAAEAAQWFDTYLREQPRGLLAREAAGRLIESYRASGNSSAAQAAASRYLARYPNGPHASLARQALGARGESRD